MEMKFLCLFVLLSIGFAVVCSAKQKSSCNNCILSEQCHSFGLLSRSDQEVWLKTRSCKAARDEEDEMSAVYGFAPFAKGDHICCPDSSTTDDERNSKIKQTTPQPQTESKYGYDDPYGNYNNGGFMNNGNRRPQNQNNNFGTNTNNWNNMPQNNNNFNRNPQSGSNPFWNNGGGGMFSTPFDFTSMFNNPGFFPGGGSQYPGNNYFPRPQGQYPGNQYQNSQTEMPYNRGGGTFQNAGNNNFNRRNENNSGSSGAGESIQCQLTHIPPSVTSGCCGLHADFDRRTDSQTTRPSINPNFWTPSQQTSQNPAFGTMGWPMSSPFSFFSYKDKTTDGVNATADMTIDNRITGGTETQVDQFPWLVLLKSIFDDGKEQSAFNCGGSLISATFVLTAGHCLYDENAQITDVEVTLAEYDKRTYPRDCMNSEEGRRCIDNVRMSVENVIIHPNYDDTKLQNDIALVRLHGKAPYTAFIRPICLPTGDIDSPDFENQPLFIAGWGRNGVENSDVKQATVVNLVPQGDCKRYYSFLNRRHVCAAGYSGQDTCKGDSGGPLMLNKNGRYFIIGIVSGKRADSPCGTSVPSLYTNVYHYLDWIEKTIK